MYTFTTTSIDEQQENRKKRAKATIKKDKILYSCLNVKRCLTASVLSKIVGL